MRMRVPSFASLCEIVAAELAQDELWSAVPYCSATAVPQIVNDKVRMGHCYKLLLNITVTLR